jgi:hypothetical protein
MQELLGGFRTGRKPDDPVARLAVAIETLVESYEGEQAAILDEIRKHLVQQTTGLASATLGMDATPQADTARSMAQLATLASEQQALGAALAESSQHTTKLASDVVLAMKRGEQILAETDKRVAEARQILETASATVTGAKHELQNEAAKIRGELLGKLRLLPLLVLLAALTLGLTLSRACRGNPQLPPAQNRAETPR